MSGQTLPKVSIIIPVYNDVDSLKRCLSCLDRQTAPSNCFEIIVVDNGSDDFSPQSFVDCARNIQILQESRPGSYAARNKGLEIAQGEIIAFTDADCRPRADWVMSGRAAIGNCVEPVSIGGRINILPRDASRPSATELYEMALVMVQSDLVNERGFAATANMWTTRKTFEAVGLFDGALLSGGDAEWGDRVRKAGFRIKYDDAIVIDHPARDSWTDIYRKLRRVRSIMHDRFSGGKKRASFASQSRGYIAKLQRFKERTKGWGFRDRAVALMVAVMTELAIPFADLDLHWRKHDRL